jgi:hypothetical protein
MPLLAFERFLAMPIAHVPEGRALAPMFWIAQMRLQFRFQTAFNHGFSQFFEQAPFPQDVLGRLVVFEQFIKQFASKSHAGSPLFLVLTSIRSDHLHTLFYSLND